MPVLSPSPPQAERLARVTGEPFTPQEGGGGSSWFIVALNDAGLLDPLSTQLAHSQVTKSPNDWSGKQGQSHQLMSDKSHEWGRDQGWCPWKWESLGTSPLQGFSQLCPSLPLSITTQSLFFENRTWANYENYTSLFLVKVFPIFFFWISYPLLITVNLENTKMSKEENKENHQ